MSIDSLSSYPQPTRARKAATIFLAVLASSTLLGGLLSAFEMRSEEMAMSQASVKTQPSTDGVAMRKVDAGPRLSDGQAWVSQATSGD